MKDQGSKHGTLNSPTIIMSSGGCKSPMGYHPNGQDWHPVIASHGEQKCIKCKCKVNKRSFTYKSNWLCFYHSLDFWNINPQLMWFSPSWRSLNCAYQFFHWDWLDGGIIGNRSMLKFFVLFFRTATLIAKKNDAHGLRVRIRRTATKNCSLTMNAVSAEPDDIKLDSVGNSSKKRIN